MKTPNVEVTGAARFYRAASVWTAGLALAPQRTSKQKVEKSKTKRYPIFNMGKRPIQFWILPSTKRDPLDVIGGNGKATFKRVYDFELAGVELAIRGNNSPPDEAQKDDGNKWCIPNKAAVQNAFFE